MNRQDREDVVGPFLGDRLRRIPNPARLALIYILVAILWIGLSDLLFGRLLPDFESFLVVQMVKGTAFVVLTGALVFFLLKNAERDAQDLQHSFRVFADNTADWEYWMGDDGQLMYVTPACERVTGYSPSAFYAQAGLMQEIIYPEDLPVVGASHGGGACEAEGCEYRIVRRDGSIRWILHECHPVSDAGGRPAGFRGSNKDITERKVAEEALRRSEKRFRTLFEEAAEGILVAEVKTRELKYANLQACRMLGRSEDEIRQMRVDDLHPGEVMARFDKALKHHIRGEFFLSSDVPVLTRNGGLRYADITATPMEFDGVSCLVGFFTDVTERLRLQNEKAQTEAHLRQAQKMESLGTLASGVAHEINNPIMGITGYADLISAAQDGAGVSGFAREIRREAKRIHRIVTNLLCFARTEKTENPRPTNLSEVIDATLSLMQVVMRHDRILLEVNIPDDLPPVLGFSPQLQQVVMNLLTNARDALNAKYPRFDENKRVKLTARPHDRDGRSWVRLTVTDHGTGIPEAVRERIYDPFFTTKAEGQGTGLGLSITYGIVNEHGGALEVESECGAWTRVHVDLPVAGGGE